MYVKNFKSFYWDWWNENHDEFFGVFLTNGLSHCIKKNHDTNQPSLGGGQWGDKSKLRAKNS